MKWQVSSMMNEMSFQLISNIFSDFSFKHDQQMDGRTDIASSRGAMAHLKNILAYFLIIFSDFCFFSRFSTRAWPTNRRTELVTELLAIAHLKFIWSLDQIIYNGSKIPVADQLYFIKLWPIWRYWVRPTDNQFDLFATLSCSL